MAPELNERTWVEERMHSMQGNIDRIEALMAKHYEKDVETHAMLLERIGELREIVHSQDMVARTSLRVIRYIFLAGLAVVMALKSGTLEPILKLLGGKP